MSHSDLAIADFYDHAQEAVDHASDWGGDDLFATRRPRPRAIRRTVTITGRPEPAVVTAPRRPARTLDERIAHRPERIASWTCSLGALSILLAIVTAQ